MVVKVPTIKGERLPISPKCLNSKIVAPKIAGINNKKENRAISWPLALCIKPEEIVIPERETPGKIASD